MNIIVALLASYLIGSLSFGYMAGKLLRGIDIRQYGSGNTGTTNIQRTLGTGPAIIVLLLDVAKGLAAVLLARALTGVPSVEMLAGVLAVLGHNWPLFHRFKGGRGIATSIGVLLGLAWQVLLIAVAVGVTIIAVTRYVSLGSIIGVILVPILMVVFDLPALHILFGAVLAVFAVWRHRQNISRLLAGTENKLGGKASLVEKEKQVNER
ncbi:MAG: glycerol-3-phosphate 1-O-acyltransferase PlsY [Dethiobacter sp.]|jgi:glycerol-3-phosphate acyltransferase PlsY|nr:glycerol-3-phosphate 1-O-acyltransferase PlsY [Dethiobacter sp.]MBS3900332.1 glycerol-3-phosphate 1-O-acyltransferase PlsY [Dethiobacter sp.]MBS3983166.1 glycerol-3-phosphate 1-O-acyltransferase PlsY [Dethiobacter sp.]MCL4462631.1 glycerol-3-phosphate 1-O-acyltransferase PlsY [Bacillota bacterium]MCL5994026.1 glycerol-3-phosphate 1-O-acyltransferase PlsY [Bacillota bacterium]